MSGIVRRITLEPRPCSIKKKKEKKIYYRATTDMSGMYCTCTVFEIETIIHMLNRFCQFLIMKFSEIVYGKNRFMSMLKVTKYVGAFGMDTAHTQIFSFRYLS